MVLTLYLRLRRGTILKTNGVTNCRTELTLSKRQHFEKIIGGSTDFHLLADALRNRHGCDTTRLGTSNEAKLAVSIFIQELCKLSCLSGPSFTDDDDYYGGVSQLQS